MTLDEMNNDKKNLKRLVELTTEMQKILPQINMYDKEAVNNDYFGVEKLRQTFVMDYNQTVQQIALEEHGLK